jgi:hypothetical protein
MVWLTGVIAMAVARAFVTVSEVLAEGCPPMAEHPLPQVAVTVTVVELAGLPALTIPLGTVLLMVATLPEIVHVTKFVTSRELPSVMVAIACICSFVLAAILEFDGVTALIVATIALTTDTLLEPVIDPEPAVMVTGPGVFAVSRPPLLIVAMLGAEDAQETELVRSRLLPSP